MVEVVVVIFLDIENSDDGNYQMGPNTLTSGQTGKPKSNMGGPGSYFFKNNPNASFHITNGEKQQIGLHNYSYTTTNQGTTDLINSYILSICNILCLVYLRLTYILTIVFWVDRMPRKK